jgi:hypothetical protein
MRASTSARSLRVDVVELGRGDQGIDRGGPLATAIGTREQPGSAPEGNAAQGAAAALLVRQMLVRQMRPSPRKREGQPARQHVIDRLGGLGVARQSGAFGAHPFSRSATIGWLSRCRAARARRPGDR